MGIFSLSPKSLAARRLAVVKGPDLVPPSEQSAVAPMGTMQDPAPQPQTEARPKPGMSLLGAIGDALSQWGGGQPTYAIGQQRRQALEQQEVVAQRRRREEMEDYQARLRAQRENPAPTDFERSMIAAGIEPRSPEGQRLYRQRVENQANPYQAVPGYDEQGQKILRFVRPNEEAKPLGPQPGAIVGGFRFRGGNPNDQSNWEPVGGAGSGQQNFP